MDDDAARHKHTRAVAFVRWQVAAEKYNAIARARDDHAARAEDVEHAAAEVGRRYAEWMRFVDAPVSGGGAPDDRTELH